MQDEAKKKIENLPVPLTQDERNQAAKRVAEAVAEIDENEAWKKERQQEFKSLDERLNAEVRHLSRMIKSGVEYRPVECEERPNWQAGTVELYRMDTGECVNFRPMSSAEKQAKIDFGEGSETVN